MSRLKIACVGDLMCGDSFFALGHGVASTLDKYGRNFLPNGMIDYLSSHDLVLCNSECVLSDVGRKEYSLRSLHMRGRPEAANYLADWGITVANVANNHILEHGYDCAIDTVRQLHNAGIKTVGAGKDGLFRKGVQITEVTLNNQGVSILGICFLKENYAYYGGTNLHEILDVVSSLAAQGKTVIVSAHWGNELMNRPNMQQKKIGRQLIEAGASLVIGHHPHVVQGAEKVGGGFIAYSIGNFIFDSLISDTRWSIILSLTMSGKEIAEWVYIPVEADKEHRPKLVQGKRKTELKREFERRCGLLRLDDTEQEYQAQYASEYKILNAQTQRRFRAAVIQRIWHLRPIYWLQILWRPIQRRLGLW